MADNNKYSVGDKVEWNWGNGTASGTVTKVYTRKQTLTIKGEDITRNASDACPAYRINTGDSEALKSHSEVQKAG